MLTLATGFICCNNFLCNIRREAVVDKTDKRIDILNREATHTLLSFDDHVGYIRKFSIGEPADPTNEIFAVFREMVGNRWKDGMEHMPGPGTGKITTFGCEFFQNCYVLLGK
jgi:hypothetical protein